VDPDALDDPRQSWSRVTAVMDALDCGSNELVHPLEDLVSSGAWRRFRMPNGEIVEHASLVDMVRTDRNRGLGMVPEALVALLEKSNYKAAAHKLQRDLLDEVPAAARQGRPNKESNTPFVSRARDRTATLARLKRDRPDLAAQVVDGTLTAHAAAVQAGIRPRTVTIRLDDPERIAATLRRRLDPETLQMLVKLLQEGPDG
jgi:hypothetical protein